MYKLAFYVPEDFLEPVKEAVFSVGAGLIGDYDQCCWQTLGTGQFRPLKGSSPFIGEVGMGDEAGELEKVNEYKVEMVCADNLIQKAVQALLDTHPYEEPAYDIWPLVDIDTVSK